MNSRVDGTATRDTRDGRIESRHWSRVGAGVIVGGLRLSPDNQPDGSVKSLHGRCGRLIGLPSG